MKIVRTKKELAEAIRAWRAQGKTIGCVPTMGALHDGHLSLVHLAKENADAVVVTIFINPTQFGPNEDFGKYPRTEEEDIRKLQGAEAGLVYLPSVEEIYPPGDATRIHVAGLSEELEGRFRPGHFDGVATVVAKLFMQVKPDIAVFGEKDFQQLQVIRRMVCDLAIPVRIIGAPIMREANGLAMSSRNRYLNDDERHIAAALHRILADTAEKLRGGENMAATLKQAETELKKAGFTGLDYMALRDEETLQPVENTYKRTRLLAAAYLGTTRLIDNVRIGG